MNEILLRQGRKLDLGRALLGLGGVAEEICGRRLAEQSLVERVQAGAVIVRAFGLKIGVWMEEKDFKKSFNKPIHSKYVNLWSYEFRNLAKDKNCAIVLNG